jgi:hypothetical protein
MVLPTLQAYESLTIDLHHRKLVLYGPTCGHLQLPQTLLAIGSAKEYRLVHFASAIDQEDHHFKFQDRC